MLDDEHSPGTPTSAAGDSIILHVPSFVQRFSAQRRILSRLRALTFRRSRAPEPEALPLQLQVEANPDWPALDEERLEGLGLGLREWKVESGAGATEVLNSEPDGPARSVMLPTGTDGGVTVVTEAARARAGGPDVAAVERLVEDNRDLKAALCRLIRISEENHAALRLLEEENGELAELVHQLAVRPPTAGRRPVARGYPAWRVVAWGTRWLNRERARRTG